MPAKKRGTRKRGKRPKMLKVGDKAPEFHLKAQDGHEVSLAGLRGKPVVLYFFPKALTSG
jgi:peroxiredoxin Q/BCP